MFNEPNDSNVSILRLRGFNLPPTNKDLEESEALMCTVKNWADIVYLTGTGEFWLLTEEVADSLHSAAEELEEWVSIEDQEQRFEKLSDEAGLLECFLAVRPENFLDENERQTAIEKLRRLSELLNENREEEDQIDAGKRVASHQPPYNDAWFWFFPVISSARYAWGRFSRPEETRLISELHDLYEQGERRAKDSGYTIEGDNYYGIWEKEIQEAIEKYRQCRMNFITEHPSVDNPGSQLSIREALKEYSEFLADCENMSPVDSSRCEVIGNFFSDRRDQLSDELKAYEDSILALASMGVATPEWALADVTIPETVQSSQAEAQEGLEAGSSAFDAYNTLLKKAVDLFNSIESKLSEWATATARNAALPLQLFESERLEFKELTDQLDTLFELAENAVAEMVPERVLFWQADLEDHRYALGYERQRTNTLVRHDFPLREFSSPSLSSSLSYVSIKNLMRDMTEAERNIVQQCLHQDGVLPARLWESEETALSYWFQQRGCKRFSAQADWFNDDVGTFIPDKLFEYLSANASGTDEVESLQDAAAKELWADILKRIIFTGPAKEKLRLFDASAQAQMFRFVNMSNSDLNQRLGIEDSLALIPPSATIEYFEDSNSTSAGGSVSISDEGKQGSEEKVDVWGLGSDNRARSSQRNRLANSNQKLNANYQLSMKRTASLARAEATLGPFNFPEESEAQNVLARLNQNGGEERDLGCYSLRVAAVAKGFAGASIALSAQAGITFDNKGLNITGTEWAQREAEITKVKVFGGASLGMKLNCSLRWKPPGDLTRQLPQLADRDWLSLAAQRDSLDQWQTLGKVVIGGEANAGYGGELGMRLGIKNGKFVAYFRAQVVIGLGAKGELSVELDLKQINVWFMMLSQALRDNDYGFVEWVDEEAFDFYSKLAYLGTTTLLDIGLLAARDVDTVNRLYELMTQGNRAGLIAGAIVSALDSPALSSELATWVQHLPPEALGPLLNTLVTSPGWLGYSVTNEHRRAIDAQQIAITKCLEWLERGYTTDGHYNRDAAKHLFERSVARMTQSGQFSSQSSWVEAYCRNRIELDEFMQRDGEGSDDAVIAQQDYIAISSRLGSDIDEYRETYSTRRGTRVRYREN